MFQPVLIYSALHTGTWFICNGINQSCKEHTTIIADNWFQATKGCTVEELDLPAVLTAGAIKELTTDQENAPHQILASHEVVIIQAHQRRNSNLYHSLLKNTPRVPVIVPFRNPLLSMNTRIWRDCKSIKTLKKEPFSTRAERATDQIRSIQRCLNLSNTSNIKLVPIDIERNKEDRVALFKELTRYCNLSFVEAADIVEWTPVNSTAYTSEGFQEIKEAIIEDNIGLVYEHLDIEIDIILKALRGYGHKMLELGYNPCLATYSL